MLTTDPLTATFAALADPTRRAILASLAKGEASVLKLAEPFDMSLPAISKHLKVLERAGLITRTRTAQWRPCRLEPQPLKSVSQWLEFYRRFWEESFDRLELYLADIQKLQGAGARKKSLSRKQRSTNTNRRPNVRRQTAKRHSR